VIQEDTEFIQKPFSMTELARKVREVLDQRFTKSADPIARSAEN